LEKSLTINIVILFSPSIAAAIAMLLVSIANNPVGKIVMINNNIDCSLTVSQ